MKLLLFEWKKTLRSRTVRLAFVLSVLLFLWLALQQCGFIFELQNREMLYVNFYKLPWYQSHISETYAQPYSEPYQKQLEQERERILARNQTLTEEQLWTNGTGDYGLTPFQDRVMIANLYGQVYEYEHKLDSVAEIRESAARTLSSDDAYLRQKSLMVVEACDTLTAEALVPYNEAAISKYLTKYCFAEGVLSPLFVCMLFLALVCGSFFSSEREHGVYDMLYTTARGRGALFCAKYLVGAGAAVVILLVEVLIGLGVFGIKYGGLQGLFTDFHTLTGVSVTSYQLTVLQFLLLSLGLQLLWLWMTCAIAAMLSVVTNHSLIAFAGGALCGIGGVALTDWTIPVSLRDTLIASIVSTYNPAALTDARPYLCAVNTVRIGDAPVPLLTIVLGVFAVALLAVVTISGLAYVKPRRRKKQWN